MCFCMKILSLASVKQLFLLFFVRRQAVTGKVLKVTLSYTSQRLLP